MYNDQFNVALARMDAWKGIDGEATPYKLVLEMRGSSVSVSVSTEEGGGGGGASDAGTKVGYVDRPVVESVLTFRDEIDGKPVFIDLFQVVSVEPHSGVGETP